MQLSLRYGAIVVNMKFVVFWNVTFSNLSEIIRFSEVVSATIIRILILHNTNTVKIMTNKVPDLRNKTNNALFCVLYSAKVLYMFRTDKLFILRRHILLYMQILVCIMHIQ
jgi:hypothetical protein